MDPEGPDRAGAGPVDVDPAVPLSAGHLCAALLTGRPSDQSSVETDMRPLVGPRATRQRDSNPLRSPGCWKDARIMDLQRNGSSCGESIEIEDLLSKNN